MGAARSLPHARGGMPCLITRPRAGPSRAERGGELRRGEEVYEAELAGRLFDGGARRAAHRAPLQPCEHGAVVEARRSGDLVRSGEAVVDAHGLVVPYRALLCEPAQGIGRRSTRRSCGTTSIAGAPRRSTRRPCGERLQPADLRALQRIRVGWRRVDSTARAWLAAGTGGGGRRILARASGGTGYVTAGPKGTGGVGVPRCDGRGARDIKSRHPEASAATVV